MQYDKSELAVDGFVEWLLDTGRSAATAAKYVHYLDVISRRFERSIQELTETEEEFQRTSYEFEDKITGTSGSLKTYKSALRAYRDYLKSLEMIGHWQEIQLNDGAKKWYKEFSISKISELTSLVSYLMSDRDASTHKWIFRGQGFSPWGLATSLERVRFQNHPSRSIGLVLKNHENDSMWEFYREASKNLEFRNFSGLNLLALMQHYGCKTRLLDFSLSPLIAVYMAIDQNEDDIAKANSYAQVRKSCGLEGNHFSEDDIPLALWAIDISVLNGESCYWKTFAQNSFLIGNKIVLRKTNCRKAGVTVVFPEVTNYRIAAQDGLFLMPNNLDLSFEKNLCAGLGLGCQFYTQEQLPPITQLRHSLQAGIVKFEINPGLRKEIKQLLYDANVSAKTVYPDLVGLGKHVGNMVS